MRYRSAVVALTLVASMAGFTNPTGAASPPAPVYRIFTVPSGAMTPTLNDRDAILVDLQAVDFLPIRADEVVVFHGPAADIVCGSSQATLAERVIGLPGETISSEGNTVYINGKPLAEPWLPPGSQLGRAIQKEVIPPGRYFMMGDNRSISCDSRYWGTIPASSIIGLVLVACPASASQSCRVISKDRS